MLSPEEISLSEDEGRVAPICHACYLIEMRDPETLAMNGLSPWDCEYGHIGCGLDRGGTCSNEEAELEATP